MSDHVEQWGRFDDAARQFVLTTAAPPRPWHNILFNRTFNAQPTQNSAGVTYRRDPDGTAVLLNWSGEQAFYVIDDDSGAWFRLGAPDATDFAARYGQNRHVIEQTQFDLHVTVAMVVPTEGDALLCRVTLADRAGKPRRVRVVAYNHLDLNVKDPYFGTRNRFMVKAHGSHLAVRNASHLADRVWLAYMGSSRPLERFAFDREALIGVYGSVDRPQHLVDDWSQAMDTPDAPALIARVAVALDAGGEATWDVAYGCASRVASWRDDAAHWVAPGRFDAAQRDVAEQLAARYGVLHVETPDAQFDRFVNIHLPHQLAYNAYWNRGWGKGFRDGMQDAWAYTLLESAHVRDMIADALPHQFADGRTVRKWAPIDRKAYNDGGVWLALATHAYVSETGDAAFLGHVAPYFESDETGTLLNHVYRAMRYLAESRGTHGLCLMPFGDWNDQLTGPGKDGKGESVWTTMAMAAALPKVAALARLAGDADQVAQCDAWRGEVVAALQQHGWNGQWFSRAIDDAGKPVGHPDCDAGRIFLLPQAWAILADVADDAQRDASLAAAREHLLVEHGYLLLAPSYTSHDDAIGHLSACNAGHVENGGNYCHASTFMMNALCKAGRVDDALDLFHRILPTNPANPPSRSRQEPFSITNCYRGPAAGQSAGRSHFSWRTGAAGWLYRTAIEGILGITATLDGLHVRGTLPHGWRRATVHRTWRGRTITIELPCDAGYVLKP